MISTHRSTLVLLAFVILVEIGAASLVDLNRPAWGDEAHFYETVKLFGSDFSLTTLRTYPEMSTPLPFIAYAAWGHLVGFELSHLRLLSMIFAVSTYLIFFWLLSAVISNPRLVFFGAVCLVLLPYMIGFSLFVYTDISAIFFGTMALYALSKRSTWLTAVSLAMAVLCRQYMAFLVIAGAVFYAIERLTNPKRDTIRQLAAVLLSALPYLALVIFWGGTSPDNALRSQFLSEPVRFHPEMLSLYIAALFVYLFPLAALNFRTFYRNWRLAVLSVIGVGFIVLFPVRVSGPLAVLGVSRVGQFHRILRLFFDNEFMVHMAFAACFLLALPIVFYMMVDVVKHVRARKTDAHLLAAICILIFMSMMPFSYLGWEKYLMPVVPTAIVYLLMVLEVKRTPGPRAVIL